MRFISSVLLLLGLVAAAPAGAGRLTIPAEFWELPRSGASVLEQAQLRETVQAMQQDVTARLIIHHDGRDQSVVRAEELRSWLISLAIESLRIELRDDLAVDAPLILETRNIR